MRNLLFPNLKDSGSHAIGALQFNGSILYEVKALKLLKNTKLALMKWNKEHTGNLFQKMKIMEQQIKTLQEEDVHCGGSNLHIQNILTRKIKEYDKVF